MAVTDSVLSETKKVLGFDEEYDVFDIDILMHINQAFDTISDLGTTATPFMITDKNTLWSQFPNQTRIATVKSYVWATVRLAFDPPATSFGQESLKEVKRELEWRLNVATDLSVSATPITPAILPGTST